LSVLFQLQVQHGHALGGQQCFRLSQRKAETGAAIAQGIGKNLLHQSTRETRKTAIDGIERPVGRLRQGRLAIDIGNGVPQRGKALLVVGGWHGLTAYMNKTGTW